MTVEQMADDGIEVSEFVRNHLHKDKIVLLGFSWGSILGIHMIQKRPDLFFPICRNRPGQRYAEEPADELCAFGRRVAHCERHEVAAKVGTHRSTNVRRYGENRNIFQTLEKFECAADRDRPGGALFAPSLSLRDLYYFAKGALQVLTLRAYQEMLSANLASLGTGFQIPMFLFEGALDERTPIELAQRCFRADSCAA